MACPPLKWKFHATWNEHRGRWCSTSPLLVLHFKCDLNGLFCCSLHFLGSSVIWGRGDVLPMVMSRTLTQILTIYCAKQTQGRNSEFLLLLWRKKRTSDSHFRVAEQKRIERLKEYPYLFGIIMCQFLLSYLHVFWYEDRRYEIWRSILFSYIRYEGQYSYLHYTDKETKMSNLLVDTQPLYGWAS